MKKVYIPTFLLIGLLVLSYSIHAKEGEWTRKADMPMAIAYHGVSEVNGKIYVIGGAREGFHINIKPLATVYEYDPNTDSWTRKADMPTPRMTHRTIAVDGIIYAIGGWTDGGFTNAVEAYDPVADKWKIKTNIPTTRAEFAIGVVNGKIYVIGGHSGPDPQPAFSIVEEYDPKIDTWTKKTDMPTARSFITGSVVNNKIYVFGGIDNNCVEANFAQAKMLSAVEIYNPITDRWTKGMDIPTLRAMLSSCTVNDMIYVMGGAGFFNVYSTVEIYDTKNDSWVKGEAMPISRASVANDPLIDGKIYVIGGLNDSDILSSTWEFAPESLQSAVSSKDKLTTTWGEIRRTK